MRPRVRYWFLVAALWPAFYLTCVLTVVPLLKPLGIVAPAPPPELPGWFIALLMLHVGTILVGLTVFVLCLVHLFRESALTGRSKVVWTVLLVGASIVAAPFYVWWHTSERANPTMGGMA